MGPLDLFEYADKLSIKSNVDTFPRDHRTRPRNFGNSSGEFCACKSIASIYKGQCGTIHTQIQTCQKFLQDYPEPLAPQNDEPTRALSCSPPSENRKRVLAPRVFLRQLTRPSPRRTAHSISIRRTLRNMRPACLSTRRPPLTNYQG